MKRLLILLFVLISLPCLALADLPYERHDRLYIDFPTLDDWRGRFTKVKTWTIVTRDNLDEHLDLVLARGESEEAIRRRYADDTLIFEGYSSALPQDACFRFERIEDEFSREVWNLRHWTTEEGMEIIDRLESGTVLEDYSVFNLKRQSVGNNAWFSGWFTNYPPRGHEAGKMQIVFRNGAMYLLSYNVYGRQAAAERYLTWREREQMGYAPFLGNTDPSAVFRSELLPRPTRLTLDPITPVYAAVGDTVTVTGTIEPGCTFTVTIDGESVTPEIVERSAKRHAFTAELPIRTAGDHQAVLTLSSSRYQETVKTLHIASSQTQAPLVLTDLPETYTRVGTQTVAGHTATMTDLTLRLDEGESIPLPIDGEGNFVYTFDIQDSDVHTLSLEAKLPGHETTAWSKAFIASFEDGREAVRHFRKNISSVRIEDMAASPMDYVGQKVELSVMVSQISFNEQGLGLSCIWNYKHLINHGNPYYHPDPNIREQYLYLNIPGYAKDKIYKGMILSAYGTVIGTRSMIDQDGTPIDVMEVDVEYVTYVK